MALLCYPAIINHRQLVLKRGATHETKKFPEILCYTFHYFIGKIELAAEGTLIFKIVIQ
jgi:hypothetical protein